MKSKMLEDLASAIPIVSPIVGVLLFTNILAFQSTLSSNPKYSLSLQQAQQTFERDHQQSFERYDESDWNGWRARLCAYITQPLVTPGYMLATFCKQELPDEKFYQTLSNMNSPETFGGVGLLIMNSEGKYS